MSSRSATATSCSALMRSRAYLLRLPPEVLGKACDDLGQWNLNSLAKSCKALQSAVTPLLYETVSLRVPMKWSRLPSIESLITSTSDNFQYIKHLWIHTQHEPLSENQQGAAYHPYEREPIEEEILLFKLPPNWASDALNTLIRLLVLRLPRHRLQTLRYLWLQDLWTRKWLTSSWLESQLHT